MRLFSPVLPALPIYLRRSGNIMIGAQGAFEDQSNSGSSLRSLRFDGTLRRSVVRPPDRLRRERISVTICSVRRGFRATCMADQKQPKTSTKSRTSTLRLAPGGLFFSCRYGCGWEDGIDAATADHPPCSRNRTESRPPVNPAQSPDTGVGEVLGQLYFYSWSVPPVEHLSDSDNHGTEYYTTTCSATSAKQSSRPGETPTSRNAGSG
ncbi:hypothetical protein VTI28DRAFT_4760 [Corynascus sepedonium]